MCSLIVIAHDYKKQRAITTHYILTTPHCSIRTMLTDSNPNLDGTTWHHLKQLHIITHNPCSCTKCSEWTNHYMQSFILQDPSLTAAEAQRDSQILGSLPAEIATLQKANDKLQHALHYTQKEHNKACHTLDKSH